MASRRRRTDASTVVFTLKNPNDQTWPFVLGTSAGPIVDSKVFPADKELAGRQGHRLRAVQDRQATRRTSWSSSRPTRTTPVPTRPKTSDITLKYYTQSQNLKLDVQSGAIDIAWRSLTPTDVDIAQERQRRQGAHRCRRRAALPRLQPEDDARRHTDAQKLAIRQAMAYSIDRQDLATNVYKGTYQPAYSMIPHGHRGCHRGVQGRLRRRAGQGQGGRRRCRRPASRLRSR